MIKKKFPRVIRRSGDETPEADTISMPPEEPPASLAVVNSSHADVSEVDSRPINGSVEPVASFDQSPAPTPELEDASANALVRVEGEDDASRRRWEARAIVERHANYSAVGGVIPLPLINVASVTGIILRMVKLLSDLYGVPFERDRARAIVIGLIGGLMPTALSTMTASTLLYIVPGSNLLGLAVSSVTASTCARRIGWIFVDHFESGATLVEFPTFER